MVYRKRNIWSNVFFFLLGECYVIKKKQTRMSKYDVKLKQRYLYHLANRVRFFPWWYFSVSPKKSTKRRFRYNDINSFICKHVLSLRDILKTVFTEHVIEQKKKLKWKEKTTCTYITSSKAKSLNPLFLLKNCTWNSLKNAFVLTVNSLYSASI